MFSLISFGLSIAYLDENRRHGVNYMRFPQEATTASVPTESPDFTQIFNNFNYIHPRNNKPQAEDKTIVLSGTYLSPETVSVEFELLSQPEGAALLIDGNLVIGEDNLPSKPCTSKSSTKLSKEIKFYANKYHHIAIIHNAGCLNQLRQVSLLAKFGGKGDFEPLNESNIYSFKGTECREGYYGSTCSGNCTDTDMCNDNGRCDDGISGSGMCLCLRGYLGKHCDEICQPQTHCSGNGRCLGDGSCQCFTGYSGDKCSVFTDITLKSKAKVGFMFYGICSIAFLVTTIYQSFKMEQSNPIAHAVLLVSSLMKFAASIITYTYTSQNMITNLLSLIPVALLAFVILRSIVLIQNQFKTTSPDFSFKLLHMSVIIVPIVIGLFAIIGPVFLKSYMIWSVAIPFIICALYIFSFSIFALFCGMKEPFEKMEELFPNLASELYASRRYIVCAAFFFIFDTIFSWFYVDNIKGVSSIAEYTFYGLLIIDIFTIMCIGLANDTVLSDIFAVEGDDGGFVPMGFATISDIDEESESLSQITSDAMFAPLYSACPDAYKDAEKRVIRSKKWCGKKVLKIIISIAIVLIVILVGFIIYVNPTYPIWSLDGMKFIGSDITKSEVQLAPNVSIYNPMRVWIKVDSVKVRLMYKNVTIGKKEAKSNRINAGTSSRVYPNVTVNLHSKEQETGKDLTSDLLTGDGIMEINAIFESSPLVMGIIKLITKVSCPQSIRVLDGMQIVDGCGRCEYLENSFTIDL